MVLKFVQRRVDLRSELLDRCANSDHFDELLELRAREADGEDGDAADEESFRIDLTHDVQTSHCVGSFLYLS